MYFQRMDGNNSLGFSRQMTAFDVTLDMLIKNNEATVLANLLRDFVTINGHEASISMVDVVPTFYPVVESVVKFRWQEKKLV